MQQVINHSHDSTDCAAAHCAGPSCRAAVRDLRADDPTQQEPILQEYLDRLAHHAVAYSPFWRRRIGTLPKSGLRLADLPILRRADLQENFADLRARPPQMAADKIATVRTSGSTGRPVEVERFLPTHRILYQAMMLRDYHWHDRDARRPIAVIKDEPRAVWKAGGHVSPISA